jgi:hypothetical protein
MERLRRGPAGSERTAPREFVKRETFAYACEAYARILERAPKLQDRLGLAIEYASKVRVSGERVDPVEVNSILADACAARNGWKIILGRCAPETTRARPRG